MVLLSFRALFLSVGAQPLAKKRGKTLSTGTLGKGVHAGASPQFSEHRDVSMKPVSPSPVAQSLLCARHCSGRGDTREEGDRRGPPESGHVTGERGTCTVAAQ